MKTVLTVAGSDPSGGAGIQADIKTITAHGLYATSAITALTVQNTLGVSRVEPVPVDLVAQQIDCVVGDIRPMRSKSACSAMPRLCRRWHRRWLMVKRNAS